jgi:hypothetical protein
MNITLPTGVVIPDEDVFIAQAYAYRCVAHPTSWMVCLHEEPPKSLNPRWKSMPDTRYPVCDKCHNLVHRVGRKDAAYYLEEARKKNFPKAVEEIESHVSSSVRE